MYVIRCMDIVQTRLCSVTTTLHFPSSLSQFSLATPWQASLSFAQEPLLLSSLLPVINLFIWQTTQALLATYSQVLPHTHCWYAGYTTLWAAGTSGSVRTHRLLRARFADEACPPRGRPRACLSGPWLDESWKLKAGARHQPESYVIELPKYACDDPRDIGINWIWLFFDTVMHCYSLQQLIFDDRAASDSTALDPWHIWEFETRHKIQHRNVNAHDGAWKQM